MSMPLALMETKLCYPGSLGKQQKDSLSLLEKSLLVIVN